MKTLPDPNPRTNPPMNPPADPAPRYVLAVDPGATGALAFIRPAPGGLGLFVVEVEDMPVVQVRVGKKGLRNEVNETALARLIAGFQAQHTLTHAYVERVQPVPHDGTVGAFKFGTGFGIVRGALAGLSVPMTLVTPQAWKRAVNLPTGATKDQSRQLASRLYPELAGRFARKKDDGRAEAVLLAHAMASAKPAWDTSSLM
jgi:hypothetical protein